MSIVNFSESEWAGRFLARTFCGLGNQPAQMPPGYLWADAERILTALDFAENCTAEQIRELNGNAFVYSADCFSTAYHLAAHYVFGRDGECRCPAVEMSIVTDWDVDYGVFGPRGFSVGWLRLKRPEVIFDQLANTEQFGETEGVDAEITKNLEELREFWRGKYEEY